MDKAWYHISLVKDGELVDLRPMSEKYGLERQDFYRHLRMWHYYVKEVKGPSNKKPLILHSCFIKAYNSDHTRRIIGEQYLIILSMKNNSTHTLHKAKVGKRTGHWNLSNGMDSHNPHPDDYYKLTELEWLLLEELEFDIEFTCLSFYLGNV